MSNLAPWLVAIAIIGVLPALLYRQCSHYGLTRRRTDKHEAYIHFLDDLLRDEKVRGIMLERGVATKETLVALLATLGELNEPGVRALAARLLNDRIVRRFVAEHMERAQGIPKAMAMKLMGQMVVETRG